MESDPAVVIRPACAADLDALVVLETACWPHALAADREALAGRLDRYGDGQWVLVYETRVVGAIYAQRIDDVSALYQHHHRNVDQIHRPGAPILQLIAVNVLPEVRPLGFGDRLLAHALDRAQQAPDITGVAAVSLCRDFDGGMALRDYIAETDAAGRPIDPILRFHHLHGAEIVGLVRDYRPEDRRNQGCGVLIRYDLKQLAQKTQPTPTRRIQTPDQLKTAIDGAIGALLRERGQQTYSAGRALMDQGLDSLDLYSLRMSLEQTLGRPLDTDLFFRAPSGTALLRYFNAELFPQPKTPTAEQSRPTTVPHQSNDDGGYAIIGIACRFPGAEDFEAFGDLLAEGREGVTAVPRSRWNGDSFAGDAPQAPGKIAADRGGFLDDVAGFDAARFALSAREAHHTDPQQRFLLETSLAALEYAALNPDRLQGSNTAFYVGSYSHDYETLNLRQNRAGDFDAYYSTGNAAAMNAGRLAYFYGSHGPAMTIDTACSSSLVAVHLACRALATGETDLALAAGVNLMLSPELSLSFSRAGMLSPHGRCATFDAAADGYVRAEGCAVVVLKRLADARRDGDPIQAVIRGSAINHDGASNGLTAPNGAAQEAVLRAALRDARLQANDIDYLETHGTGTPLGDAVELRALGAVFADSFRQKQPLLIGSVKTNIGHAEAAAGLAGLLKVVAAMQRGRIPRHLHYRQPNGEIDPQSQNLQVTATAHTWPTRDAAPARAGVSSFGFSGTNAHVIVEAAPRQPSTHGEGAHLVLLSAHNAAARTTKQQKLLQACERHRDLSPADIAKTSALGRAHEAYRQAWVVEDAEDLCAQLAEPQPAREPRHAPPPLVMMFSGQGAQYSGMGRVLYEREPVFRAAIDACAEVADEHIDLSLQKLLFNPGGDDPLVTAINQTQYTQPALFALGYSLAELWRHWGLSPTVWLGHSVGEYVAACQAGVFDLADGMKLIAARGRLMQALPECGTMATIIAGAEQVAELRRRHNNAFDIAAYNSPQNTVIAGPESALTRAIQAFENQNIRCIRLRVSHAFHSHLMDPMLETFAEVAASIHLQRPRQTLYSNLTGRPADEAIITPDYWVHHVREPVRFQQTLAQLTRDLPDALLLEAGPKPVLCGLARRCRADQIAVGSLAPGEDDLRALQRAMATLYEQGFDLNWSTVFENQPGRRIAIPTTAFTRQTYWLPEHKGAAAGRTLGTAHPTASNPFLGEALDTPLTTQVYAGELDLSHLPWLEDHCFAGRPLLPGAAMIAAALSGVKEGVVCLHDVLFAAPLFLEETPTAIQNHIDPKQTWTFYAKDLSSDTWIKHASARLDGAAPAKPAAIQPTQLAATMANQWHGNELYRSAESGDGLFFGPAFRGLKHLWQQPDEAGGGRALGQVQLPHTHSLSNHPALLDSGLQTAVHALAGEAETPFLLMGIERVTSYGPLRGELWSLVTWDAPEANTPDLRHADVTFYDRHGQALLACQGLHLKRAAASHPPRDQALLYHTTWTHFDDHGQQAATAELGALAPLLEVAGATVNHEPDGALAQLEGLSLAYIQRALAELNEGETDVRPRPLSSIRRRLGITANHERLTGRLLAILAEADLTYFAGGTWRCEPLPKVSLDDCRAAQNAMVQRFPELHTETALLARCGESLAEVLRGRRDPLDLIFPDADLTTAIELYERSPTFAPQNRNLAAVVEKLLQALPADRGLRILEIGAGTGGTSAHIVPLLGTRCTEYVFTDITAFFSQRVTQRFSDYPFVTFKVLDLEKDPAAQGFEENAFDLIIAANVVHATRDIAASLRQIQRLTAAGGLFLLLEGTQRRRWLDLIFGLTDGWWRFNDDHLRPDYPLLNSAAWREALAAAGFADCAELTPAAGGDALFPQSVFVARKQAAAVTTPPREHWWVLADRGGLGGRLARDLRRQGQRVDLISLGDGFYENGEGLMLDPRDAVNLKALRRQREIPDAVAVVWGLDLPDRIDLGEPMVRRTTSLLNHGLLNLVQTFVAEANGRTPQLHLVTRGATVADGDSDGSPSQRTLWGFSAVLEREYPECQPTLIDLPQTCDAGEVTSLVRLLLQARDRNKPQPNRIRYREHRASRPLLTPFTSRPAPVELAEDGAYLITGGLGGTGLHSAQRLMAMGAHTLVLVGRSAPNALTEARLQALRDQGVTIHVRTVDVADYEQVEALMTWCDAIKLKLKGVIHAAGTFADRLLADHDWAHFETVFAAKVSGAWNLHLATRERHLDFLILYGSAMTLLPTPGLSNYTAANAFLEGLAGQRRAHGLPTMCIAWGPWSDIGMAARVDEQRRQQWARFGLTPLSREEALDTLSHAVALLAATEDEAPTTLAAMRVDWSSFAAFHGQSLSTFYQNTVAGNVPNPHRQTTTTARDWRNRLAELPFEQHQRFYETALTELAAAVLGRDDADDLNPRLGLFQQGLDSLASMELRARLQQQVDLPLPTTLLFKYPSIAALAAFLAQVPSPATAAPSTPNTTTTPEDPDLSGLLAQVDAAAGDPSLEAELAALENLLEE